MTSEYIIRMAREAADKDKVDPYHNDFWVLTQEELERFFHMAQTDVLERIGNATMKAAGKAVDTAMVLEREACAKVADTWAGNCSWEGRTVATNIAKEIRARVNT
mgnify:CR=1 FL=1